MEKVEKAKKPFWKKWWFWAIVVIVIIAIASGGNSGKETAQPAPASTANEKQTNSSDNSTPAVSNNEQQKQTELEKPKEPENKPTISKAEFERIKTGMTYEEVVKIIGSEGELLSEAGEGEFHTVMYSWKGEGAIGANANFTFQNNKLQAKAQFGLE